MVLELHLQISKYSVKRHIGKITFIIMLFQEGFTVVSRRIFTVPFINYRANTAGGQLIGRQHINHLCSWALISYLEMYI